MVKDMGDLRQVLTIWLCVTASLFMLPIVLGILKVRLLRDSPPTPEPEIKPLPVDILVPLKGVFPDQTKTLESWLNQSHPDYSVVFIVESEDDPANQVVDELCVRYGHARKVVSGISTQCAQKNYGLIAGARSLRPESRIILFCDSTNIAPSDWLQRFVRPLDAGTAEVVTTFRAFDPKPETIGGVGQAVYATFIYLLLVLAPKPWGGATAILRETFERLEVAEVWGRTVVDDLVLGNVLHHAGIKVLFDHRNLLKSPLTGQSIKGLIDYLDRQILFPKFTNPGMWAMIFVVHTSVSLAVVVSAVLGIIGLPLGMVSSGTGLISLAYLAATVPAGLLLKTVNPFSISTGTWLAAFYSVIFLGAFVLARSVFCTDIVWHGRTYRTGAKGVVLSSGLHRTKPDGAA
jgi:hypothetical protein